MNPKEWKKLYLADKTIAEIFENLKEIFQSDTYAARTDSGHDFVDMRIDIISKIVGNYYRRTNSGE